MAGGAHGCGTRRLLRKAHAQWQKAALGPSAGAAGGGGFGGLVSHRGSPGTPTPSGVPPLSAESPSGRRERGGWDDGASQTEPPFWGEGDARGQRGKVKRPPPRTSGEADGHCGLRRERPREGKGKGRGKVRAGRKRKVKGVVRSRGAPPPSEGEGPKGRAANGDRSVGAAGCSREHHTKGVMPTPPSPQPGQPAGGALRCGSWVGGRVCSPVGAASRSVGAAGCSREHHTKGVMPNPPQNKSVRPRRYCPGLLWFVDPTPMADVCLTATD